VGSLSRDDGAASTERDHSGCQFTGLYGDDVRRRAQCGGLDCAWYSTSRTLACVSNVHHDDGLHDGGAANITLLTTFSTVLTLLVAQPYRGSYARPGTTNFHRLFFPMPVRMDMTLRRIGADVQCGKQDRKRPPLILLQNWSAAIGLMLPVCRGRSLRRICVHSAGDPVSRVWEILQLGGVSVGAVQSGHSKRIARP